MGIFDSFVKLIFGRSLEPDIRGLPSQPAPRPAANPPVLQQPPVLRQPPKPKPKTLNLDATKFTPLTDAEAKKQAKGLGNAWGNPWFGRRDLIPPTADARTLLIDRAMVGHGFVTPEELAEIHKVGAEMDKIRPDLAQAHSIAEQSIAQSKEERKKRKEQKKREAAEKKQRRAEAIAKRKQTEIVFLGRGVSSGLADTKANVEKLQAAGLPILAHPRDVADALKLTIGQLRWLAFHAEAARVTHYIRFNVPKKSGGMRQLAAPHKKIAACQQWILENILKKLPTHDAAHGFVTKRNTLSNARPHVSRAIVINADLQDFFPTITFPRVKGLFQELGYSPAAATILALLCTEAPRRTVDYAGTTYHVATGPRALPQGACTSPALSNLAARGLDRRLTGICKRLGWTYTRYADDLTFSGGADAAEKPGYLLARVRHIAQDEGFAVNEKKTRIQRRNTAQSVTGIVVNERPGVPRKLARRIRAILHRAKTEGLAAQNRANDPQFEAWLQGTIAYIKMVNPQQGHAFAQQLRELQTKA